MLYGSRDFGAFAAGQPLEIQPDQKWHYSSGTANLLARIIRQTLEAGRSELIILYPPGTLRSGRHDQRRL